jgi:hypothetical protein
MRNKSAYHKTDEMNQRRYYSESTAMLLQPRHYKIIRNRSLTITTFGKNSN